MDLNLLNLDTALYQERAANLDIVLLFNLLFILNTFSKSNTLGYKIGFMSICNSLTIVTLKGKEE